MLSGENRNKLNSIIEQMKAKGESEDSIQEMVNQFKSKYDTIEEKQPESLLSKFTSAFSPVEPVKATIETAKGGLQTIVDAAKNYKEGKRNVGEYALQLGKGNLQIAASPLSGMMEGIKRGVGFLTPDILKEKAKGIDIIPDSVKEYAKKAGKGAVEIWNSLSDREKENISAGAEIASVLPVGKIAKPLLRLVKEGGELATGATKTATGKLTNMIKSGAPLEAEMIPKTGMEVSKQKLQEKAAQEVAATKRVGMPLTIAEEKALIPGVPSKAPIARIEDMLRSTPGAQGVFAELNENKVIALKNAIEKNLQQPISNLDDSAIRKVADSIEKNLQDKKDVFAKKYSEILHQGRTSYIDSEATAKRVSEKLNNKMGSINNLPDTEKNRLLDLVSKIKQTGSKEAVQLIKSEKGEMVGTNYKAFTELLSIIGSERRRMFDKMATSTAGLSEQQAMIAANAYKDVYDTMKAVEYNHLRVIGGNQLVNALKSVDSAFSVEKGPLKMIERMFGIGKGVTEKGFVEDGVAFDKLVSPKNKARFDAAMKVTDDETKNNIGLALYGKIVRNASEKGNLQEFSAAKYLSEYQKYKPILEKVISKDQLRNMDDIAVSIRRANLKTVNLVDPSNPSGTGVKSIIGNMILSAITTTGVGGYLGGAKGGLTGLISAIALAGGVAGAARLAAKGMTRIPLTAAEKSILLGTQSLTGAATGYMVAPEGEETQSALIGAGLGLGGIPILKTGLRTGKKIITKR